MGKLGKKARKFAKKNLPAVLKQRRKNKIVFKKRPSKDGKRDVVEKEVVRTEVPNERDADNEANEATLEYSLDVLFAADDDVRTEDDSDSDGYLSEDPSSEDFMGNDNDVTLEDAMDIHTLSSRNQKIYEELAEQKKSLDKLKKKHPKFLKFLESYNEGDMYSDEDGDEDEDETNDDLMLKDVSNTTNNKVLTSSVINVLSKLVTEDHNESALISLLNAYRAACHLGAEETGPKLQDSETFCNVYTFMLSEADNIFRVLLKLPSPNCKKGVLLELKNKPIWKKTKPMIKSYLRSTLFLLKQVTDSEILAFSINRLRASIVFFAAFPSLLTRLIEIIVPLWATGGGTLSATSSLLMQDVVSVCGSDYFDACFVKSYNAYIALCRTMETVDTKHIEFLRDSYLNLCSLDVEKIYTEALFSVEQLANILRHAKQNGNKEAIKKIYSWQYAQLIDLWVTFIAANVNELDVQSLLYMTIQLINGVAHMFSGPRYFPLRKRCIQWLNKLSSSCGIFIPVASLVLDMLEYKVSKDGGKSRKQSVHLASSLKLPKFWLKSQNFVDQCVYSAVELLAVHFLQWSYQISFPELATAPLIRLRKFHENTTVESLKRVVKRLIDQVEQNVEYVQKKREDVAFSPKDHESVDLFLQFEKGIVAPFTQYYKSVIEKAASKMPTSPQEPKKVKRKKMQDSVNTVNGDTRISNLEQNGSVAANGDAHSKKKKRKLAKQ